MSVTVPSVAIWINALGERAACGPNCAEAKGRSKKPSARPPPVRALICRKDRRLRRMSGPPLRLVDSGSAGLDGLVDCLTNARIGSATAKVGGHRIVDLGVGGMRR